MMSTQRRLQMAALLFTAAVTGCGRPSYKTLISDGIAEYEQGRYPEAIAMFNHAAEADRERPEPAFYRGRCYLALAGQQFKRDDLHGALRYCDRALYEFDSAVGAFPGYSQAVQAKADALKLKGKHAAALEVAQWAAAYIGPQAKMLIFKAREYAQAGDIDNAQLALTQAVSMEPENPASHAELGLFYMRCGNDTEAIRSLQRAYELNPGAPGVVAALARLGAVPRIAPTTPRTDSKKSRI